ncbi:AGAP013240-PA-like protein [Anopheles sinensis]|uniref:AGAP013240-PA-like protein n=1 Tax=Anopheles sinensis TaxID=74873 RepID=A0A084WRU1_ANOSI|nr:AGAP013240-PA-like protein [Anopheles sinensis]
MKLPKWIKRGPKSNVGVKSIVKSSGGSDGAAGGGTGGGNSQRHRRKSSSASLKGKRKRNSYVSSAITTKNFYPAEHFFKNGPLPSGNVDAGDGDEALMMARFRTLPASFGAGYYQQPGSAYHQGPQQAQQYQHQRPHPLGLPNGDGFRNTLAARGGYNGGGERLYRETLAPNGMQSGVQQQAFFPPQQSMTLDRRYFAPSIGHHADSYRTVPTDNGFVPKSPYYLGHTLPPHNSTLQQQKQQSNATGYELGVPTDRVRQILPTSATGLYSGQQQQQQHPHQRGLRGSFRRYKIPSPAEIFEMINDKYIHPVGAGKKKASKVGRTKGWLMLLINRTLNEGATPG